jgi:hypothetical protein
MPKSLILLFGLLLCTACSTSTKKEKLDVNKIVQQAIDSSGTDKFDKAIVQFQFRNKIYRSIPTCNGLQLQREFKSDSIAFLDELYQGEFNRFENETFIQVKDSMANLYAESINSVHYFVQLPFRLNDEAVQKKWVGMEKDEQNEYFKIKVSFAESGGGQDFEDVYYFWLDSDSYLIQYLAYSFKVNGGGIRFRKAIQQKEVNGITFLEYENYQPALEHAKVENSLNDYLKGTYTLLSKIENSDISVTEVDLLCD